MIIIFNEFQAIAIKTLLLTNANDMYRIRKLFELFKKKSDCLISNILLGSKTRNQLRAYKNKTQKMGENHTCCNMDSRYRLTNVDP